MRIIETAAPKSVKPADLAKKFAALLKKEGFTFKGKGAELTIYLDNKSVFHIFTTTKGSIGLTGGEGGLIGSEDFGYKVTDRFENLPTMDIKKANALLEKVATATAKQAKKDVALYVKETIGPFAKVKPGLVAFEASYSGPMVICTATKTKSGIEDIIIVAAESRTRKLIGTEIDSLSDLDYVEPITDMNLLLEALSDLA